MRCLLRGIVTVVAVLPTAVTGIAVAQQVDWAVSGPPRVWTKPQVSVNPYPDPFHHGEVPVWQKPNSSQRPPVWLPPATNKPAWPVHESFRPVTPQWRTQDPRWQQPVQTSTAPKLLPANTSPTRQVPVNSAPPTATRPNAPPPPGFGLTEYGDYGAGGAFGKEEDLVAGDDTDSDLPPLTSDPTEGIVFDEPVVEQPAGETSQTSQGVGDSKLPDPLSTPTDAGPLFPDTSYPTTPTVTDPGTGKQPEPSGTSKPEPLGQEAQPQGGGSTGNSSGLSNDVVTPTGPKWPSPGGNTNSNSSNAPPRWTKPGTGSGTSSPSSSGTTSPGWPAPQTAGDGRWPVAPPSPVNPAAGQPNIANNGSSSGRWGTPPSIPTVNPASGTAPPPNPPPSKQISPEAAQAAVKSGEPVMDHLQEALLDRTVGNGAGAVLGKINDAQTVTKGAEALETANRIQFEIDLLKTRNGHIDELLREIGKEKARGNHHPDLSKFQTELERERMQNRLEILQRSSSQRYESLKSTTK